MVVILNSNSSCPSEPSSMLGEHDQVKRKRIVSMDERQSVRSSDPSMGSRIIADSTQRWADEDDEYSCNSSSESSDPQLMDDNAADVVRQSASIPQMTNRPYNDPAMIEEDGDSDTLSATNLHRPCYESVSREIQLIQPHRSKRVSFCWLPNNSCKVTSTSNGGNVPYHNHSYIGIPHNPPIVCAEGIPRGNLRSLHRKAWLEVSDSKHRYGKHLRMYYRHWESLYILTPNSNNSNCSMSLAAVHGTFFDWLDSVGKHAGQALPEIPDCPRSVLDSDTVTYIDDMEESKKYAVHIQTNQHGAGRLILTCSGSMVRTGSTGWMFVIRDNVMYVAPKVINGSGMKRFHHSSFFGGRAVQAAGIVVTDEMNGYIQQILPHSGHYRPDESDVQRVLYFLHEMGVCWSTFTVDVQQFLFIDRSNSNSALNNCCMKKKKVESLHLRSAVTVADFLSHKARCIQPNGIFATIEARRFLGNSIPISIMELQ